MSQIKIISLLDMLDFGADDQLMPDECLDDAAMLDDHIIGVDCQYPLLVGFPHDAGLMAHTREIIMLNRLMADIPMLVVEPIIESVNEPEPSLIDMLQPWLIIKANDDFDWDGHLLQDVRPNKPYWRSGERW